MSFIYDYLIADTLNDAIDVPKLRSEIEAPASGITAQLAATPTLTVVDGDNIVRFSFKATLSTNEEASLDTVVAAHDGIPIPTVDHVVVDNSIDVVPRRPTAPKRAYAFSHNWCDQTTWYYNSIKVSDKLIGVGDGVTKDFVLEENYPVIELGRGKITDDHNLVVNHDQCVCVYLGTVTDLNELTEREPFEESGGDYWVDYDSPGTDGTMVHFETAPAVGEDIIVDYNYCKTDEAGCSEWYFGPPDGKKWIIDHVEAQFTEDVELTDTLIYQAWIDHPTYGWMAVPGENELRYHSAHNFDDYVRGSQPSTPAWGGTSKRGRIKAGRIVQWDYDSSIVLYASQLVKVKIWCAHDRPLGGGRVTITIYAMEEDE